MDDFARNATTNQACGLYDLSCLGGVSGDEHWARWATHWPTAGASGGCRPHFFIFFQ